jgi:predicted nucleic-acid-binding Zn-ribbon protein
MPAAQQVCPKCKSKMSEGFIVDQGYGHRFVSQWVEGPPEKGLLLGVKVKNKRIIDTTTYRCTSCGYLESYAK